MRTTGGPGLIGVGLAALLAAAGCSPGTDGGGGGGDGGRDADDAAGEACDAAACQAACVAAGYSAGACAADGRCSCTGGDERCGDGLDNDGDGAVDEDCECTPGTSQACYSGPPATRRVGLCRDGSQTCAGSGEFGRWGACTGQVLPGTEVCDRLDNDCDLAADEGCPGECVPTEFVAETICADGLDNDCDGLTDCRDPDCPSCCGAEVCGDGADNDCDTLPDCADADCCPYPACSGAPACCAAEVCGDGADNDCDGRTDCSDPDCCLYPACSGSAACCTAEVCGDGADNDCDGRAECFDTDCCSYPACSGSAACCTAEVCGDGADNDCDGRADCSDTDCCSYPACAGSPACCTPSAEVCGDGRDNDCDGLTDEESPGCRTCLRVTDRWERPPSPTGEEVVLGTWTVTYAGGTVTIAENCCASGTIAVDDQLVVTTPRGTIEHRYSRDCGSGVFPEPPLDITSLLVAGANSVTIAVRDICAVGIGSTALVICVP
jgi:hypothetical protein